MGTNHGLVAIEAYAVHIGSTSGQGATPVLGTFAPVLRRCVLNTVQIFQESDKWVVLIYENGEETRRSFDIEQHAHSYADGQRIRLRLPALGPHTSKNGVSGGGALSH